MTCPNPYAKQQHWNTLSVVRHHRVIGNFFFFLAGALLLNVSLDAQESPVHESRAIQQLPTLKSLPDATEALQKQIDQNRGSLILAGSTNYRLTKPLLLDLVRHGAVSVRATGGATLIMDGPGPALRIVGNHQGTASPKSFLPATWNQRMPIVSGIEILGAHPQADGIELVETVAPVISKVSVRWCRHGIHLVTRNRNVVVSDCHLYENSGVGLYLDKVNLHQINVSNSHISYNRAGGIVVRDGNVRNLQVSGCDIEGNMPDDSTPTTTANILIDVSATEGERTNSVAEVSITGCTIQHAANYSKSKTATVAPGGSNIRLRGKKSYPIDSVTISGNVLSDTTVNVEVIHAHDVAIVANNFFAPSPDNLKVTSSQRVAVSGNTFNPRQFSRPGTITFKDCADCVLTGSTLHKFETPDGAVILDGCDGCLLSSLLLTDCGSGIRLKNTNNTTIASCRVSRTPAGRLDLEMSNDCKNIALHGNVFAGVGGASKQNQ